MKPKLHYVYDPLCGWCYGASPLLLVARDLLPVVMHGGGMMTGSHRRSGSEPFKNFVMPHVGNIESLTGERFGRAYLDELLQDKNVVFDSEPPITAIMAVDALNDPRHNFEKAAPRFSGADLLARMQKAHFVQGRNISNADVIAEIVAENGVSRDAFEALFAELTGVPTQIHINESRQLLARHGGAGFPTFIFEENGQFELINISEWHGRASTWREWLARRIAHNT